MPVKPATTVCAFVALELPRAVQTAIAREIARLQKEIPGLLWMDPYRTHLTLRFLGWTTRERLDALEPHLAAAAGACLPITAPLSGLGTFPPSGPGHARASGSASTFRAPGRRCTRLAMPPPRNAGFLPSAGASVRT